MSVVTSPYEYRTMDNVHKKSSKMEQIMHEEEIDNIY